MMPKISGILPATPRILSTDLSRSQSQRTGAPDFWNTSEFQQEASTRSSLAPSALDRLNWSKMGRQTMNDQKLPPPPAIPDAFQVTDPGQMYAQLPGMPAAPEMDSPSSVISGPGDLVTGPQMGGSAAVMDAPIMRTAGISSLGGLNESLGSRLNLQA